MKEIKPENINNIVAHRIPIWHPPVGKCPPVKPGEWLLQTWQGRAEKLLVELIEEKMPTSNKQIKKRLSLKMTTKCLMSIKLYT